MRMDWGFIYFYTQFTLCANARNFNFFSLLIVIGLSKLILSTFVIVLSPFLKILHNINPYPANVENMVSS